jgi:Tfp pilus assembly protein PilO
VKLNKDKLPKWLPLAGIVVGGLLVALIGWKLVVSPQGKKASALDAQAATVQQQIASNLAAAAKARQTPTVPQIKVAAVYKLAKAMPSTPDIPDLLIELSQVARDSGVTLDSLSPNAPALDPVTGQTAVPVGLTVSGDFYTITDLLYRLRNFVWVRGGALEATGRLFSVDSVTLGPGGKGNNSLTASVNVSAFVYGAPAAAATTTAPPATDTSTDTTSTTTQDSSGAPSAAGAP